MADCASFKEAVNAETEALSEAEGSIKCNCSPIISDCSPISLILDQIRQGNIDKKDKVSVSKVEGKKILSNDTDWVSATNGIEIFEKCFKLSLQFHFNGNYIELDPNKFQESKEGFDLVDENNKVLFSINILNESGQMKFLKLALLKKYLGFEEEVEVKVEEVMHQPLDDMRLRENSFGNYKPSSAMFGCTRDDPSKTCKEVKGKRRHMGIDILSMPGTKLYASGKGKVISNKVITGYGWTLAIQYDEILNLQTKVKEKIIVFYTHFESKNSLEIGALVENGMIIGETGINPYGKLNAFKNRPNEWHIHIEVMKNEFRLNDWTNNVDPLLYFKMNN